jgi:hypothetical protein
MAPPSEACLSNVTLTAKQRHNFLRFLNRHGLKRFLVVDIIYTETAGQHLELAQAPLLVGQRLKPTRARWLATSWSR